MDLLKAITSPLATGAKPSKKIGEKSSSSSSHSESKKEHHRKKVSGSSGELSLEDGSSHKSKKMKPLYVNKQDKVTPVGHTGIPALESPPAEGQTRHLVITMMLPLQPQLQQIPGDCAPASEKHSPYLANLILIMTL